MDAAAQATLRDMGQRLAELGADLVQAQTRMTKLAELQEIIREEERKIVELRQMNEKLAAECRQKQAQIEAVKRLEQLLLERD